jgi:hypothetical protein
VFVGKHDAGAVVFTEEHVTVVGDNKYRFHVTIIPDVAALSTLPW